MRELSFLIAHGNLFGPAPAPLPVEAASDERRARTDLSQAFPEACMFDAAICSTGPAAKVPEPGAPGVRGWETVVLSEPRVRAVLPLFVHILDRRLIQQNIR